MVRVLHIAMGSGTFGGAARFAINYYKYIDKSKIRFDFLFCNKNSLGLIAQEPILCNSKIFTLNILNNNSNSFSDYLRLINKLEKILKKEKYPIIHIDTGALPVQVCCLLAARLAGVKIRIAHSHSAGNDRRGRGIKSKIKRIIKPINRAFIRWLATDYFACSIDAGINVFGYKGIESPKYCVVKNAIETRRFIFNKDIRNKVRDSEDIDSSTIVFGHVGRFDKVKNHLFLIDVFSEINKLNHKTKLWIIGDGDEKEVITRKINASLARKNIRLFGERTDINELMQGMDMFILPSFFEGLSIVAVEAQCAGLPIFASDSISKEHNITGFVEFMSIKAEAKEWAQSILDYLKTFKRIDTYSIMVNAGYDIENAALKLENFYNNSSNMTEED